MPEPVRSHAIRNREHILQVASEAFAESGDTSLNMIAKRAGVGAGTLYRHFPIREDLILAVYRTDVRRVVDQVPDLLASHAPLDAFRVWFTRLADYVRVWPPSANLTLKAPPCQEPVGLLDSGGPYECRGAQVDGFVSLSEEVQAAGATFRSRWRATVEVSTCPDDKLAISRNWLLTRQNLGGYTPKDGFLAGPGRR